MTLWQDFIPKPLTLAFLMNPFEGSYISLSLLDEIKLILRIHLPIIYLLKRPFPLEDSNLPKLTKERLHSIPLLSKIFSTVISHFHQWVILGKKTSISP
jgi:hypothetical protein